MDETVRLFKTVIEWAKRRILSEKTDEKTEQPNDESLSAVPDE